VRGRSISAASGDKACNGNHCACEREPRWDVEPRFAQHHSDLPSWLHLRPPPRVLGQGSPFPYTAPTRSVRCVVDEATDRLDPTVNDCSVESIV